MVSSRYFWEVRLGSDLNRTPLRAVISEKTGWATTVPGVRVPWYSTRFVSAIAVQPQQSKYQSPIHVYVEGRHRSVRRDPAYHIPRVQRVSVSGRKQNPPPRREDAV